MPAGEDDAVLTPARLRLLGDEDAVRDQLVLATVVSSRSLPGLLGHGDPMVDPVRQEPPHRLGE